MHVKYEAKQLVCPSAKSFLKPKKTRYVCETKNLQWANKVKGSRSQMKVIIKYWVKNYS